jgi:hypothetical protein
MMCHSSMMFNRCRAAPDALPTRGGLKILILSNDGHGQVQYTVGYMHCGIVSEENESNPIIEQGSL